MVLVDYSTLNDHWLHLDIGMVNDYRHKYLFRNVVQHIPKLIFMQINKEELT